MADYPQIYCHLTQKLNLGNYESAEVTIGVSGIPYDANDEMLDQAMGTIKLSLDKARAELRERVQNARDGAR